MAVDWGPDSAAASTTSEGAPEGTTAASASEICTMWKTGESAPIGAVEGVQNGVHAPPRPRPAKPRPANPPRPGNPLEAAALPPSAPAAGTCWASRGSVEEVEGAAELADLDGADVDAGVAAAGFGAFFALTAPHCSAWPVRYKFRGASRRARRGQRRVHANQWTTMAATR